jgi:Mlc titration factor MtfA (ptsG expression regulator)
MLGWFRRRRRKKLLAVPFPAPWREILERYPFYRGLDDNERAQLEAILRILVAEKSWEGIGLELTDEIRVTVAGAAALLLLEIEHEYFEDVTSILIYPTTFRRVPQHGVSGVPEGEAPSLLGEAWYRGPVRLAWDTSLQGVLNAEDGGNVILHEFAHRLDMLDGFVDGTPQLKDREHYAAWTRVMTEEFERLQGKRRGKSMLDPYGRTNEGEFFAVATEAFFEKPRQMKQKHPQLYDLLRDYFQQDPEARLRRGARLDPE